MSIIITLADVSELDKITPLFDQYRVFYGQTSNPAACNHFLFERMINHESLVYLAHRKNNDNPIGFAQLYPSFSSISLQPIWILNDLYVIPKERQTGVGKALIHHCQEWVISRQDKGLVLSTAITNTSAQALYETCGFEKENEFQYFSWNRSAK